MRLTQYLITGATGFIGYHLASRLLEDGHGEMARDFTYIDELVEAIVRLADIPPSEANRVESVDTLSKVAPFPDRATS